MTEENEGQPGKRRGRPPGKRGTFSFRVTADLRARLEAAAAASGRPVSEEIERRLDWTFQGHDLLLSYFGSSETLKLAQAVSAIARDIESRTGKKWDEDLNARQHFADAIERFMDIYFYEQGIERQYFGLSALTTQDPTLWIGRNAAEFIASLYGLRSVTREQLDAFLATPEGAAALAKIAAEQKAGKNPSAPDKS